VAFSEFELKYIDNTVGALCRRHSPPQYQNELRFTYEVHRHDVSVWEVRPAYKRPGEWTKMGVAKFKYDRTKKTWKLYWMRQDMKWHLYDPSPGASESKRPNASSKKWNKILMVRSSARELTQPGVVADGSGLSRSVRGTARAIPARG
jgi:hypothetical protein